MEKTKYAHSELAKESRKRIYEVLIGKTERDLDAVWPTLRESLTPLEPDDDVLNQIVTMVQEEFESDRQKQVDEFRAMVIEGFHRIASIYNDGEVTTAKQLLARFAAYLSNSSEAVKLPLAVDPDIRFPGLVAPEAIKAYSKFTLIIEWIDSAENGARKIKTVDSIKELYNYTEQTFFGVENGLEVQSAAD